MIDLLRLRGCDLNHGLMGLFYWSNESNEGKEAWQLEK